MGRHDNRHTPHPCEDLRFGPTLIFIHEEQMMKSGGPGSLQRAEKQECWAELNTQPYKGRWPISSTSYSPFILLMSFSFPMTTRISVSLITKLAGGTILTRSASTSFTAITSTLYLLLKCISLLKKNQRWRRRYRYFSNWWKELEKRLLFSL